MNAINCTSDCRQRTEDEGARLQTTTASKIYKCFSAELQDLTQRINKRFRYLEQHVNQDIKRDIRSMEKLILALKSKFRDHKEEGFRNKRYENRIRNLEGNYPDSWGGQRIKAIESKVSELTECTSHLTFRVINMEAVIEVNMSCLRECEKDLTSRLEKMQDSVDDLRIELYEEKIDLLKSSKKRRKKE